MACRMSLTALSVVMTLIAIVLSTLGVFLKQWWMDPRDQTRTYGLMTVIQCPDNICVFGKDSSDGWIVFVRVCSYAEFILLLCALVAMCVGRLVKTGWLTNFAIATLGIACLFSLSGTFTLITVYPKLTKGFMTTRPFPTNYVVYNTLPIGLIAISGTFCVPAFISLAIRQTKGGQEAGSKKNAVV